MRQIASLLFIVLFCVSCKKENDSNPDSFTTIQFLDAVTNKPVPGITVMVFDSEAVDFRITNSITNGKTDAKGQFVFKGGFDLQMRTVSENGDEGYFEESFHVLVPSSNLRLNPRVARAKAISGPDGTISYQQLLYPAEKVDVHIQQQTSSDEFAKKGQLGGWGAFGGIDVYMNVNALESNGPISSGSNYLTQHHLNGKVTEFSFALFEQRMVDTVISGYLHKGFNNQVSWTVTENDGCCFEFHITSKDGPIESWNTITNKQINVVF